MQHRQMVDVIKIFIKTESFLKFTAHVNNVVRNSCHEF